MTETTALALYGLLVLLTLMLQATGAMQQLGIGYLLTSRDEGRTVTGMAARFERALNNSVVAMTLFAPAVLLLAVTEQSTAATRLCALLFLLARVAYVPAYVFGLKGIRTAVWAVGFFATLVLYFASF